MALDRSEISARLERAASRERAGDLAEAGALYLSIIAAEPLHAEAQYRLGRLSCARGQPQAGLGLLRQAASLEPESAPIQRALGDALMALGRADEAAACIARAIALDPGNTEVLELARQLAEQSIPTVAKQESAIAEAASCAAPRVPASFGSLEADEDPFEAIIAAITETTMATAERAVSLKPQSESDLLEWAKAYGRLGNHAAAAEIYRAMLNAAPDNPLAAHMLAATTGRHDQPRATDGYVIGLFDDFAPEFDRNLAQLEYRAPQLAIDALAEVSRPERSLRILDLGCGTGLCGPLLRPYAQRLVGVDLAPGMLAKARERDTYDLLVAAEATGFLAASGERFDCVVSTDVLIYFGRLEAVVAGIARVLRPGGRLIFTVEHLEEGATEGMIRLNPHGRYSHSESYVREVLAASGFVIHAIDQAVLRLELGKPVAGLVVHAVIGGERGGAV